MIIKSKNRLIRLSLIALISLSLIVASILNTSSERTPQILATSTASKVEIIENEEPITEMLASKPITPPQKQKIASTTSLEHRSILFTIGVDKGLNSQVLEQIENVISCESSWNTNAIGDNGTSFGLVS